MQKIINQILKFGVVGGLAFLIDYFLLMFLASVAGLNPLVAAPISFTVSLVFNYICSMKFVFESREDLSRQKEFLIFLVLSLIGLGINQLVIWFMIDAFPAIWEPLVKICSFMKNEKLQLTGAKLVATFIVMVWNFVGRKVLLEKKEENPEKKSAESLERV